MTDYKSLIAAALAASKKAYAPYSGFFVGAALQTKGGKIYTGCNIENAAYSATVCAERTAFFSAVKEGEREFSAIAIVGGKNGEITDYCPPCGVCRQVISEFCDGDFKIVLWNGKEASLYTLKELLPLAFTKGELK